MININSVAAASSAANNLNDNQRNLQRSLSRLSSGYRINSAADDAGGLAVSLKLSASIRKTEAISTNVGNAVSFLQTQDGVLTAASSILERMSELSVLAQDNTKTVDDLALYDQEFTELKGSMNALLSEEFNGISLFDAGGNTLEVITGESGSTVAMTQADLAAVNTAVAARSVSSAGNAATAQTTVDAQIIALGELRGHKRRRAKPPDVCPKHPGGECHQPRSGQRAHRGCRHGHRKLRIHPPDNPARGQYRDACAGELILDKCAEAHQLRAHRFCKKGGFQGRNPPFCRHSSLRGQESILDF